jgi:SRSO17 transposase
VQRQYSGTAGRTENCQIGVFAAYATTRGRALVDRELYLPKSWTDDRDRCRAAHIPDERAFATKPDLAKAMVLRAITSPLPIAWVTADAAYGQEWRLRRMLEETGLGYVLAVPKSQQVPHFGRVEHLFSQAPDEAWERRSCGDGAKGPRVYHWAALQITSIEDFDGEMPTYLRWALARRSVSKPEEIAYYLGYAPLGTPVEHLVRVAGMRWAIEEAFQAAKNECGLDQYEVRRYTGWMRHIALAMLAHAFLAVMAADAAAKGAAETVPASHHHRGRGSAAPGNCPLTHLRSPTPHQRTRAEMVTLAQTTPSRRPTLPLSAAAAHDPGAARERVHGPKTSPLHSPKPPLNRGNVKVLLEY